MNHSTINKFYEDKYGLTEHRNKYTKSAMLKLRKSNGNITKEQVEYDIECEMGSLRENAINASLKKE